MAISFREFPWYIQALLFLALAIILIGLGEYVPISPVAQARNNLEQLHQQDTRLNQEVAALQVYERRYAEFREQMNALQKQLQTLQAIVPEDKELDEFMRQLQGAALASGVQIRKLTSQPVTPQQYHFDMPFQVDVDGPYFNILDFFARLSRLSRIINVSDLTFNGFEVGRGVRYPMRPGTTVTGTITVTTFFTTPGQLGAPAAGARPAATK